MPQRRPATGLFACYYLDHTFINARKLAVLSSEMKQAFHPLFHDALLVCTCHRVEAYFPYLPDPDPIEAVLGIRSRCITGETQLRIRLTGICCGVESMILGEKFIFHQVAQAVNELPKDHAMKSFGETVLEQSGQIRRRHGFYADGDYEDITISLIDKLADAPSFTTLVVVGAGMLSQQVARHAGENCCENVIMVTRVAKKFRKKNRDTVYPYQVCSLNTLPGDLYDTPYHCFIATTNIHKDYQARLFDMIGRQNCRSVIDMSSIPAFQSAGLPGKSYITMYDAPYLEEVDRSNAKIEKKKKLVESEIFKRSHQISIGENQ